MTQSLLGNPVGSVHRSLSAVGASPILADATRIDCDRPLPSDEKSPDGPPPPNSETGPKQTWDAHREIAALIPALRAFARTLVRNSYDADDLVQETLAKGIANAHRFQPGTSLKSWLFTILRNTFYSSIKITNREHPGAAGCASEVGTMAASQEWSMRGLEIRRALDQLQPDQREVLVMIGVLGISYEEAAEICGCAVGTIKSRLNRARHRMLVLLEAEDPASLLEEGRRLSHGAAIAA